MIGGLVIILSVSSFIQDQKVDQIIGKKLTESSISIEPTATSDKTHIHNYGKSNDASSGQGHVRNIFVSSAQVQETP